MNNDPVVIVSVARTPSTVFHSLVHSAWSCAYRATVSPLDCYIVM